VLIFLGRKVETEPRRVEMAVRRAAYVVREKKDGRAAALAVERGIRGHGAGGAQNKTADTRSAAA